jgi:predicted nuclease of predicted toxin-antitoxin system
LAKAFDEGRVVITHDSDFGTLSVRDGIPFVGIVRLRPGHISPAETVSLIQELIMDDPELESGFLIVVRMTDEGIRIRIRQHGP